MRKSLGGNQVVSGKTATEMAMKLNLSHGLLIDNLLGHIKEVKPVS